MKSTTYFAEITNQKTVLGKKTRIHLLACLLTLCQLRNFQRGFTENCFVLFCLPRDLSHVVKVALIFSGIDFYGMISRLKSNQGEGQWHIQRLIWAH